MENALTLALANAASNAPKGESLHLENLDSIADPTQDEPQSITHHTQLAADEIISGWNELHSPRKRMVEEPHLFTANDPQQDGLILVNVKTVAAKIDLTNARLDALADMITEVSTTITTAAQSMNSEPNHKHRSLHEWDDSSLINELVERENDLMPFYFELLKRIGSPELHSLVMSSMQGKNNSMVILAQLCAAMGTMSQQHQSQYPHISEAQRAELKARSELDRITHEQGQYIPATVMNQVPPQTKLANPYEGYSRYPSA